MRVLIVEPSRDLAQVLSRAFEVKGILSNTAYTAQEGVLSADKNKPDAVVLELLMSEHNGLEFIHEFKSYPDWFDVPIVVYSDLSAKELSKAPGWKEDMNITKHFYKPTTTLEDLTDYISSLVDDK